MKYNTERIITSINCIIAWIALVLVFINKFTDNDILTGFIYGLDTMIILMSVVLFIIINHNFKIEMRQFNKEMGYREDFDLVHRLHLITIIDGYKVSTIDLGRDHSMGMGEPLYYETIVFPSDENDETFDLCSARYSTKKEAKKGHKRVVKYIKEKLKEERMMTYQ